MSQTTRNRLPFYILLAGIILLLLWLGLKVVRVVQIAQSLQARQLQAETMMAGGLTRINPDQAEDLVLGLREDVVALKRETAIFMPLRGLFSGLDKIGPTLDIAPQLIEMADAGTLAAVYLVQGLKPGLAVLNNPGTGGSPIGQMVQVVDQARPQLIQAAIEIDRVAAARRQISDTSGLPFRVQELLRLLDQNLPLAQDGLRVMQVFPAIMGQAGPRTYLIVAQNEDELRATGGFISGVGLLQLNGGQIVGLEFIDANVIDDWANKPYDFPPQPIYTFMGLELFLFRDANFWPDFPTSAENMMNLYTYGRGVPLDGVIAVDQQFVALVVGALGPISLDQYNLVVTGDNTVESMRQAWEGIEGQSRTEWVYTRKDFIGFLAAALRNQLENQPGEVNWPDFLQAMFAAVQEKHLQIYMRDPIVADMLDAVNFDGQVENPAGQDFLLLVDTNMGYNKASALLDTQLAYEIVLNPDGSGLAELTVNQTHTGNQAINPECVQGVGGYGTGITYNEMIHLCYWSYLRVYAPTDSQLLAASGHPAPARAFSHNQAWNGQATMSTDATGLTLFENFALIPYGQSADMLFQYALPATITQVQADGTRRYSLQVMKQAGSRPRPLTITLTLPPEHTFVSATPAPQQTNGSILTFTLLLNRDTNIVVDYR
ncbi:MAG: DUF4012 domain-containing protein [Chloroflexi bacterium]|nr:DUF4012 domain-containing protein [Chloroflexota bacterium]